MLALLCFRNQRGRLGFRYSILPLALPSPKPPNAISSWGPTGVGVGVSATVEPGWEPWGEVSPPYYILGNSFSSTKHVSLCPLPTPNLSMEATSFRKAFSVSLSSHTHTWGGQAGALLLAFLWSCCSSDSWPWLCSRLTGELLFKKMLRPTSQDLELLGQIYPK